MKYETVEMLKNLNEQYKIEFGKICQKLLALSFKRAGFNRIKEREVQGVDIDASNNDEIKYTIEVKTTTLDSIKIEGKDIKGLAEMQEDGYKPLLAALRIGILDDWIFAEADYLRAETYSIYLLDSYNFPELQQLITPYFEEEVSWNLFLFSSIQHNKMILKFSCLLF